MPATGLRAKPPRRRENSLRACRTSEIAAPQSLQVGQLSFRPPIHACTPAAEHSQGNVEGKRPVSQAIRAEMVGRRTGLPPTFVV